MSNLTNSSASTDAAIVIDPGAAQRWLAATMAANAAGMHIVSMAGPGKEYLPAWCVKNLIFVTSETIYSPNIGAIVADLCKKYAPKADPNGGPVLDVIGEIDGGF